MRTKAFLSFYGMLILSLALTISCAKKAEVEVPYSPRYQLPEIDEDLDGIPEDTGEEDEEFPD